MFEGDILLNGKHASYAKFLSKTTEKNDRTKKVAGVFETVMDVYKSAIVIGLVKGLMSEVDNSIDDDARMFADKVIREKIDLEYLFQMCMLIDNSRGLSNDDKIERAFKGEDAENFKENLELFNAYARGGIKWLYEHFTDGIETKDEYLARIYEIVENYREENC